jgi:hypothetical protein
MSTSPQNIISSRYINTSTPHTTNDRNGTKKMLGLSKTCPKEKKRKEEKNED